MDTMIRTFFRHLLESIKSLKRNGWMTVASVSAVTITLTLVGVFMAVIMNATKLAEDIEGNVDVSVFVDIGTNEKDMKTLEKQLKEIDHVKSVKFSSKDQELKKIQDAMGNSWSLFEGDNNPLYDVYVVQTSEPSYTKQVSQEAGKLANVSRADYGGTSSDKILKLAGTVRTWGLAAAALLLFIAMFLISNTIRISPKRNSNHAISWCQKRLHSLAILFRRWLDWFDRCNYSGIADYIWVPRSIPNA